MGGCPGLVCVFPILSNKRVDLKRSPHFVIIPQGNDTIRTAFGHIHPFE
jgi:hypothetical protein